MLRALGSIVLPFKSKKASLALRIESLLENISSIGINCMCLEMLWGEARKCSATVVGLDLVSAVVVVLETYKISVYYLESLPLFFRYSQYLNPNLL